MNAKKLAGISVGLIVVVGVAAIVFVANIDVNKYKPQIVAAVKDATGRDLEIKGDIKLGLFPRLAAEVSGVSFSNASWGSRKEMATIGAVSASVELFPLMTGNVQIGKVILKDVDVLMETSKQGVGNWSFDGAPVSAPKPAETRSGNTASAPAKMPTIESIRLENLKFAYIDGVAAKTTTVSVASLDLAEKQGATKLDLRAQFNGHPITLSGNIGSLASLASSTGVWPIAISGDIAGAKLGVNGGIREPAKGKGYDLKIDLASDEVSSLAAVGGLKLEPMGPLKIAMQLTDAGPDGHPSLPSLKMELGKASLLRFTAEGAIRDLANQSGILMVVNADAPDIKAAMAVFGQQLPADGPFKASAKVQDAGAKIYRVNDLLLDFGGSDLAGQLTANVAGARPVIAGQFSSKKLDLPKLVPQQKAGANNNASAATANASGSKGKPGNGKVIPSEPIPFDALNSADADISYKAEQIILPSAVLRNALVQLVLKGGELSVKPLAEIGGGRFNAAIDLSGRTKGLSVKADAKDIILGTVLRDSGSSDLLSGGRTSLNIDLKGVGASPQAMAATLNGQAYLNVGEGDVDNRWLNLLSPDIAGGLGKALGGEKNSKLNCVIAKFDIKDGLASAKSLFADIVRMNVRGEGNVNFGSEQPNLKLTPTSNTPSLASLVPPMLVKGSFAEPSIGVDPLGLAASAASMLGSGAGKVAGAVPGLGGLLGSAVGGSTGAGSDQVAKSCADALALAEGRKLSASPAAAQPKGTAPVAAPQAPAGSGVRDTLKGLFGR